MPDESPRPLHLLGSLAEAPSLAVSLSVHPYIAQTVDRVERLLEANPLLQARATKEMNTRLVPAEGAVISHNERARLAARCALKARVGDIDGEFDALLQTILRGGTVDPAEVTLAHELAAGLRFNDHISNADIRALDAFEAALTCSEADGPEAEEALANAVVFGAEAIALRAQHAPALCAQALADYVEMVGVRIGAPATLEQHIGF